MMSRLITKAELREAFWLCLLLTIAIVGCAVSLLADAAAWCEDKLRDACNAIEEHL